MRHRRWPVAKSEPLLAHQFSDRTQQVEADSLGMWVFICTEVMFFGALFTGYALYRFTYDAEFRLASHPVSFLLGSVNTGVLLTSSLFMALALHAAQRGDRRQLLGFLWVTAALGVVFLAIKLKDYSDLWDHGLVPALHFAPDLPMPPRAQLFYVFFFFMTGLHALHVLIGVVVLLGLSWLAYRGRCSPADHPTVENVGLYWHLVDVVWVFLYPLFYLMGRSS